MKIDIIRMYHITMPLAMPFETSFGRELDRECILVEVSSHRLIGWGECVAAEAPFYSYETATTAWHVLSDYLIPAVLGKDLEEPGMIQEWMKHVRGHPMAKAALDQACWDLAAKRDGLSFAQKLAQPYPQGSRDRVPVGVSIGIQESVYDAIDLMEEYFIGGYSRVKLKIKPGYDLEMARKVREIYPDETFMLDANSAYTLDDVELFQAMDDLNLLMIEQPLGHDDIYDHSKLRSQIKTPLCLDESIISYDHARYAIALGACDIINVKPARVGGWTVARQIHDLCVDAGIGLWVGGMLETGVGRAGQLALASLPGFTIPGDISETKRYYDEDIVAHDFVINMDDNKMRVPAGPGLGVEVDEKRLARVTMKMATFKADYV